MSSRFVDTEAVERLSLGACRCDGTPHDDDWVDLRSQLSGADWYAISSANTARTLKVIVKDWNLTEGGKPVPLDEAHLGALDLDTFRKIDAWIENHIEVPTLPNASGAPSRNGSKASASLTRTTPKRG